MKKRYLGALVLALISLCSLSWSSDDAKLNRMCKVLSELSSESIGGGDWLKPEGSFGRYSNLKTVKYRSSLVPVLDNQLISVDDLAKSKFDKVKLYFSESTTEILIAPLDNSHFDLIASEISNISEKDGVKFRGFIKTKTFREQLDSYLTGLRDETNCGSNLSQSWSKVYVEEILSSSIMSPTKGSYAQVFGDGIVFDLQGGTAFVSVTDDKKYILMSVSYRTSR
ncbi:hypothetical protein [Microbulbifer sp. CNSA002]|uniref:hypothetical protein n=1 Tax=unclassified Microbulbifer TaxID=2619833 RepID=UPI0039B55A2A